MSGPHNIVQPSEIFGQVWFNQCMCIRCWKLKTKKLSLSHLMKCRAAHIFAILTFDNITSDCDKQLRKLFRIIFGSIQKSIKNYEITANKFALVFLETDSCNQHIMKRHYQHACLCMQITFGCLLWTGEIFEMMAYAEPVWVEQICYMPKKISTLSAQNSDQH